MKSDKLQVPQISKNDSILELQLKSYMQIIQRGGRVTRSIGNPTSRVPQHKMIEKSKALVKYLGEPCLKTYLNGTNVKYKEFVSEQYLVNKKMRRLNRHNLPDNCLFYQKTYNGYQIKQVKLLPKKAKNNEYLIEQTDNSRSVSSVRNLLGYQDIGFLMVPQTLVFIYLSFQQFQKMFNHILPLLNKNYHHIKMEQLPKDQKINSLENVMVAEPQRQRNQNSHNEIIQEDNKYPKFQGLQANDQEQSQIFQVVNRDIPNIDHFLFKKLSFPKMGGIMWPATVIEPLIGEKAEFNHMLSCAVNNQKQNFRNESNKVGKASLKILQKAFDEVCDQNDNGQQKLSSNCDINDQDLAKKLQMRINQINASSNQCLVHLIGTLETRMIKKDFIKWEQLTNEEVNQLLAKSHLRELIEDVNSYIENLNKFKALQYSQFDSKNSFFRLCKYESESNETELCIPIRMDQTKEDKRVLVRFLRDQHPVDHEVVLLQWIEHQKLSVNFTLPKHNEMEKKFYYLLGNYISIQEGINHIYSDFYYIGCNFNKVLRLCYPQNQLRRIFAKEERCIYCFYRIQNIAHFRCKFCLKFCHQECTCNFKHKQYHDSQTNAPAPIDIYQTDNDEQVWNCEQCSPCNECQMPVKSNYLKCSTCSSLFHIICGRLKGISDNLSQEQKYTCENCLKCRICSNKLKYQQYFVEKRIIFCMKCYKDFKNNEYCIVCMKEVPGKWVQCDKTDCNKWVHVQCDSYFKEKENKQMLQKSNYSCPQCRRKERRKIYKWVVEQLKYFDEYQFFYEPEYEEIIGYKDAISNSICIFSMREKSVEGGYDSNPYQLIKQDLDLLVKNATTFNMPKDEAHYRAKILLIVGMKFIDSVRDLLQCNEEFLVNQDLQEIFTSRRKQFYVDIYEHYLQYLLNYKSERAVIEVKRHNALPFEQQFFSSKVILNRSFANAEFKFKIKKKPHRIQNLFTIPRLSKAAWWPIRTKVCYYHPDQLNPIIFDCQVCWQSYCCTKTCLNHRICPICNSKGCGCDLYQCKCPVMKQKQRKSHEGKINSALSQSKLEKRQYTQYYKHCLKCVLQNLKVNWCYLCRNFCYYAYQKCAQCGKYYHISCEKKNKQEEMAIFYQNKSSYKDSYQNTRLPHTCYACSYSPKNTDRLKQLITAEVKSKASKLNSIGKYVPIFSHLYEQQGIRLTTHQIINLVYHNFQPFAAKEQLFEQFQMNFSTMVQNHSSNRVSRQQFREYYLSEITRKLSGQTQHEKYISFVETKEMKELKLSKKFFKIYSKHFNNMYFPANFLNNYEIKYHLEHLTSKLNHLPNHTLEHSHLHINDQQMVATNFREESHFNFKNFERIKIEAITSYVSPKSKKNIYFTNKQEKFKIYLRFWSSYYEFKRGRSAALKDSYERRMVAEEGDNEEQIKRQYHMLEHQHQSKFRQYERYLRFHSDYQNLTDCIYKEESPKSLLFDANSHGNFNPFDENTPLPKFDRLSEYKSYDDMYNANKSEMLMKCLSHFALNIYEQNKVVLKKGSTCILSESKKCWRILKKCIEGGRQEWVQISLYEKQLNWVLQINEDREIVRSIDDIARRLRKICPIITTFEDVAEFMGFALADTTFYQPNHFTHLLQTTPLDSFNRKERKREVLKVYDKYEWQRQGYFTLHTQQEGLPVKYEYNVTKKQLFYLKKRNCPADDEYTVVEPKVVPFITFQDIKKDLDEWSSSVVVKEKDNFPIKEPNYDVYIAPSKIDRLGLFIRNFTKRHTIVVEYVGEVISEAMADVRQQKFHFGCYMFGLVKNNTRQQIIDATFIGNMARYLNHSCDPNCKARIEMGNGQPRIFIYTIRDVKQNQELTYDYQFKIDTNQRLICKCKSKNCQGRLN